MSGGLVVAIILYLVCYGYDGLLWVIYVGILELGVLFVVCLF